MKETTVTPELPAGLKIKGRVPFLWQTFDHWKIVTDDEHGKLTLHPGVQWHSTSSDLSFPDRSSAVDFACLHADLPPGWKIENRQGVFWVYNNRPVPACRYATARDAYLAIMAASQRDDVNDDRLPPAMQPNQFGWDEDGHCSRCGLAGVPESESVEPHQCPPGFQFTASQREPRADSGDACELPDGPGVWWNSDGYFYRVFRRANQCWRGFRICPYSGVEGEPIEQPDLPRGGWRRAQAGEPIRDLEFCCKARPTADPPQDCDFPFCGCSRVADEAVERCIECGWLSTKEAVELRAELTAAEQSRAEARAALMRLADLPICHLQLPDGSVPESTEAALTAWHRVATEARAEVERLSKQRDEWKNLYITQRDNLASLRKALESPDKLFESQLELEAVKRVKAAEQAKAALAERVRLLERLLVKNAPGTFRKCECSNCQEIRAALQPQEPKDA